MSGSHRETVGSNANRFFLIACQGLCDPYTLCAPLDCNELKTLLIYLVISKALY